MIHNYLRFLRFFRLCVAIGIASLLAHHVQAQVTMPVERVVFQRGLNNRANVPIEGNCPANSVTIKAKVTPLNGGQAIDWAPITTATNGRFSGQLDVQAGWYLLEVRALDAANNQTGYWTVNRVGVGEVFIAAGQSNAQAFPDVGPDQDVGPNAIDDRVSCLNATGDEVREYLFPFQFSHLDGLNQVGPLNRKHYYGRLGDLLVSRLNVPVLILGAAAGGTSSEQYRIAAQGGESAVNGPDAQLWGGQEELIPYRGIGATLNHYATRIGLRGILWFQGESDKGKSGTAYFNNIQALITKTRSDIGYPNLPWVISQTSWFQGSGDEAIRAAQRQLVSSFNNCYAGPNTDNYGNEYRDSQGTHFAIAQLPLVADLWNQSLTDSFFQTAPPFQPAQTPTLTTAQPLPVRQYAGGHLYVSYMDTKPVSGATYTVQLLTESGAFVANLGSGTEKPLRVFLPDGITGTYRIQVVSSAAGSRPTFSEKLYVFSNSFGKGTGEGLKAEYYSNQTLTPPAVITRTEGPLDMTWMSSPGAGMPSDNRNWTARWTGQVEIPITGTYTFKTINDDGTRVWVNNQLLIDDWADHPWAMPRRGTINLNGGQRYDIKLELRQAWYAAQVKLLWIVPGQQAATYIPKDRLYAPTSTTPPSSTTTTPPPSGSAFALTAPLYNCQTGAFSFQTTGGNGTAIEFQSVGITGWTTNPNHLFDECARTCADTPPFVLYARQGGQTVSYTWSRQQFCAGGTNPNPPVAQPPSVSGSLPTLNGTVGTAVNQTLPVVFTDPANLAMSYQVSGLPLGLNANGLSISGTPATAANGSYQVTATNSAGQTATASGTYSISPSTTTPPPSGGAFALVAPLYNCQTGAFSFQTTGGNGTAIEFQSVGITGWTTNPNHSFDECARTCADTPPFMLKARQNGVEVSYTWSRQQFCAGAARKATAETPTDAWLAYPNPVRSGQQVTVQLPADLPTATVRLVYPTGRSTAIPATQLHQQLDLLTIELPVVPVGLYVLEISGGQKLLKTLKLLIIE